MSFKLLFPLPLLALLACGGGGSTPATTGTLTLKLGSDSTSSYSEVWVSLEKVEVKKSSASSWSTLATVEKSWDLMALQNGNGTTLATAASLATGTYDVRLTWATQNYAVDSSYPGTLIPSGETASYRMTLPTTTTATGTFTISDSQLTTAEVFIQGNQIAQWYPTTSTTNVHYLFHPTAEVVDLAECATLTGTVKDSAGTALSDAEVFAEVPVSGLGTILRRAVTTNGTFTLEGLPIGKTYYVATQPSGYPASSAAGVSAASATDYTVDITCGASATPGSLEVDTTTASSTSQGTWAELYQTLATGSSYHTLAVRSQILTTGSSADSTTFEGLYPSAYTVEVQRSTSGGDAVTTGGDEVTVTASTTATDSVTTN
nr:DUF4382 domain-containing protein [uncultured Holophaga sp.]